MCSYLWVDDEVFYNLFFYAKPILAFLSVNSVTISIRLRYFVHATTAEDVHWVSG